MNTVLDERPGVPAADEMTLESALAECGWEQQAPAGWRLPTQRGDCLLVEVAHSDRWRQFQMSGGATPQSASSRVLEDNLHLFGPAKLIARPGNSPICRLDVPESLAGFNGHSIGADGRLQIVNPSAAWATAVSACATGRGEMAQTDPVLDDAVADDLKQAGWSMSLDDGQMHIHMQLPGVYRQLAVERDPQTGVKLTTELVDLPKVEDDSVRAMMRLANAINARVPLVRLAISGSTQNLALRAEISFGATLIPGTFLLLSLHAFETAVALSVREFEALRDPELARLVLAAATARDSKD